MRSSRSRSAGLSLFSSSYHDESRERRDNDQQSITSSSPKSFASFFGRSKASKSRGNGDASEIGKMTGQGLDGAMPTNGDSWTRPNDFASSNETALSNSADAWRSERAGSRSSGATMTDRRSRQLGSQHYRSLSRSLNDLGHLVHREEHGSWMRDRDRLEEEDDVLSLGASTTSGAGNGHSPLVRSGSKSGFESLSRTSSVHPKPTILSGWLNRRTAKKDQPWRLHWAVLNDTKLTLYKSGSDVSAKCFIHHPPLLPSEQLSETVAPPVVQAAADVGTAPILTASVSMQSLSRSRRLLRDNEGKLIAGSVAGLCRQMLLDKDDSDESLAGLLINTIGHWTGCHDVLDELFLQIQALSDASVGDRPAGIVAGILNNLPSALLSRQNVSSVLTLLRTLSDTEQERFQAQIADARNRLNLVITVADHGLAIGNVEPDADEFDGRLTRDILWSLPASLLAEQLHAYHMFFLQRWNPLEDRFLFAGEAAGKTVRHPLVFGPREIHFLTTTVLDHLLSVDVDDQTRARLCTYWINVGRVSKTLGDMASWIAVILALCSPAVTRLRHMWSLVDDESRQVVDREWSYVMRDLFRTELLMDSALLSAHVLAPDLDDSSLAVSDVVPFLGDVLTAARFLRGRVKRDEDGLVDVTVIRQLDAVLRTARQSWITFNPPCAASTALMHRRPLLKSFKDCFTALNNAEELHSDLHDLHWLECSLKCEPATSNSNGWRSTRAQYGLGPALPLALIDVLPVYKLFDTTDLLNIHGSSKRTTRLGTSVPNESSNGASLRRLNSFPPTRIPATYTTGNDQLDEITRARHSAAASDWKMLRHLQALTGLSDQAQALRGGDIILKDLSIEIGSANAMGNVKRPLSIIVENRKRDSARSKRTSLLHSQDLTGFDIDRLSLGCGPSAKEYIVRAGTCAALIDLVVVDLIDHDKPLHGDGGLDREEYLRVFFGLYRTFTTPVSLIDEITRRLSLAIAASDPAVPVELFPLWDKASIADSVDPSRAEAIYTGAITAIVTWLELYPNDLLGSVVMYQRLDSALAVSDVLRHKIVSLGASAQAVEAACYRLRAAVQQFRYSPQYFVSHRAAELALEVYDWYNVGISPDETAEQVINQTDLLFSFHQQSCTLEDWMRTFDTLAQQGGDPRGYFVQTNTFSTTEDLIVSTTIPMLARMRRPSDNTMLIDQLPLPVRNLVQLWQNVYDWALQQVTAPEIELDLRIRRMELFLGIIRLSQSRLSQLDIALRKEQVKIVPGSVADAVAHALIHPESRQFVNAWAAVSRRAGLNDTAQTIEALVARTPCVSTGECGKVTPSINWILDRMLEINCYVPDHAPDNERLVNYDKLGYIHNLLENLDLLKARELDKVDLFEQYDNPLLCLLKEAAPFNDPKCVKQAAQKENAIVRALRLQKPFSQIVAQELEKLKRDARQRESVERQMREMSRTLDRKRSDLVGRIHGAPPSMPRKSQTRSRYGMGSLLKAVRPLSVAITGNSWQSGTGMSTDFPYSCEIHELPIEYDAIKSGKMTQSFDMGISSVRLSDPDAQTFVVKDGQSDVLLQTPTAFELEEWVRSLQAAVGLATLKRRSGGVSTDQGSSNASRDAASSDRTNAIKGRQSERLQFGVSLEHIMTRDEETGEIPMVARVLMDDVEARGLHEQGIYRISGSMAHVQSLKAELDANIPTKVDLSSYADINAVAGGFKAWLRELPEPLLTFGLYADWIETARLTDEDQRLAGFNLLLSRLSLAHAKMTKALLDHLARIVDNEDQNQMFAHNLAIVFGPNLLRAPSDPVSGMNSTSRRQGQSVEGDMQLLATTVGDFGKVQTVVRHLILASRQLSIHRSPSHSCEDVPDMQLRAAEPVIDRNEPRIYDAATASQEGQSSDSAIFDISLADMAATAAAAAGDASDLEGLGQGL
ncbi:rho GTPase-activating protein [Savitreella phatthalungensis]